MNTNISKHDLYLTRTMIIDDSYFEEEIERAVGEEFKYLNLMYAYFSIKKGLIDKANNIMNGINLDISNSFINSLILMNKALINGYNGRDDKANFFLNQLLPQMI